jgi:hypothetical protein
MAEGEVSVKYTIKYGGIEAIDSLVDLEIKNMALNTDTQKINPASFYDSSQSF